MNTLQLQELSLRNFKGIKNFTFTPNGENSSIYGDNAKGKTTVMDAFLWLLFDKDSLGKKDFEIKTLVDGVATPKLEHEVEAVVLVGDQLIKLKKIYKENYTKKRGQLVATFTGHVTEYYVNDVPMKKKEYQEKVVSLSGSEDVFRLLTSPTHFAENLTWTKQRELLLEVCGGITDQDVIESDASLSGLLAILDGETCDNRKKVIGSTRSKINKDIQGIPARIDELSRTAPVEINVEETQQKIAELRKQVSGKDLEIFSIVNGEEISKKKIEITKIDNEIAGIKNSIDEKNISLLSGKTKELDEQTSRATEMGQERDNIELEIRVNEASLKTGLSLIETLRVAYRDISARVFTPESCPTCGKPMTPSEEDSARATFLKDKSDALENNNMAGGKQAQANKVLCEKIEDLRSKLGDMSFAVQVEIGLREDLEKEVSKLKSSAPKLEGDILFKEKTIKKETLKADIKSLEDGNTELVDAIKEKRYELQSSIETLEGDLASQKVAEANKARIEELNAEEKSLAAEYEKLEGHLFLIEKFIKVKVSMLESRINDKFSEVSFKLFDDQINGGVKETCEVTVDGVPYGSINNAARIQAGLDIINTMANHYSFSPTIFIDNRESVTSIPDVQAQVISLIVSAEDKTLRVE